MSAKSRISFGLQIVLVCLYITPSHYYHCADIGLKKVPVGYIVLSVWVRLSIFAQLSIIQYMGRCVFNLPISLVMIGRIYILCLIIIIKSEVWIIIYCLGLGHKTMVYAVCLYILIRWYWINITRIINQESRIKLIGCLFIIVDSWGMLKERRHARMNRTMGLIHGRCILCKYLQPVAIGFCNLATICSGPGLFLR